VSTARTSLPEANARKTSTVFGPTPSILVGNLNYLGVRRLEYLVKALLESNLCDLS